MQNISPLPPEQNADAWGSVAESYDQFAEAVTCHFAEDAARLVHLNEDSEVIDVAAGTGAFTQAAARRGAHVLATDFSARMLQRLEHNCAERGLTTVKTAVMDGQDLKVADSSFDVAASLFGLIFFPDHDRGLRELLRVLKPGGQTVVTIWPPPPRGEMQQIMGRVMAKVMPMQPKSDAPPHWAALEDVDGLRHKLLAIGFGHAHALSVTHLWTFESPESFVKLMRSIAPPAAAFFETLSSVQQQAFQRAFVEDFQERQGNGPYGVTHEGIIAVGSKSPV